MLEAADGSYLATGGAGHYVVYGMENDSTFYNLVRADTESDATATQNDTAITVGGQEVEYPLRHLVDFTPTLQAARIFATNGTFDPSLPWEER